MDGEDSCRYQTKLRTGASVLVAGACLISCSPPAPSAPVTLDAAVQLFDAGGSELGARVSPDGQRVAYYANPHGHWDLFLGAIDGSDIRRVTSWSSNEIRPAWSPDGRRLVFASDREGSWDLWTVDADGGETVRLTEDAGSETAPDWAADGRILFNGNNAGSWDVWVMREGDTPERLTVHEGNEWHPRWAPDGRRIVFYPTWSGWTDLWVLDPDRDGLRDVLTSEHEDFFPTWSADGRWLLFASDRARGGHSAGGSELWAMAPEAGPPIRLTDGFGELRHIETSPDGRWVFLTRRVRSVDVHFVPAEGGPTTRSTSAAAREVYPQFARGGAELVYASDVGNETLHLYARSVGGGAARRLTAGRRGHEWPSVSPDGSWIAFAAGGGDYDSYDAMMMPVDGGPIRRVTSIGNVTNLSWCGPRALAFTHSDISYADALRLWMVDRDGEATRSVSDAPVANASISCHPDGRTTVVTASDGEQPALYLQPVAGGTRRRLPTGDGGATDGAWSPDGERIAFASDRSGSFEIWVVGAAGGEPIRLTETAGEARNPRWAPDGSRLAFELRGQDTSIWRVETSALTRILADRQSAIP